MKETYPSAARVDDDLSRNLNKLDQIAALEPGWDGADAKAFSPALLSLVRDMLARLDRQPELFPTAGGTIQLEYDREDGAYLEIQATLKDNWDAFARTPQGEDYYFSIPGSREGLLRTLKRFYG